MEDARTATARKRRRRILVALLLLVVLPIILVGAAFVFLQSPMGTALVQEKVLEAVSGLLEGKVEAGDLQIRGDHLVVTNLKLFTPEGELVASIERVEADVALGSLLGQLIRLRNVKVRTPRLMLQQDERGWNIARAVASPLPAPLEAVASATGWRIAIEDLELTDGEFDLQQGELRITAKKLTASGDAQIRLAPLEIAGSVQLDSTLTSPLEEKLVAKVAASTADGPQSYDLSVTLGGSRVRGKMELPAISLMVDELVAAPRELSAFLPSWPIKPVVFAKGSLSTKEAALQLSAGKARATLEAKYDLETTSAQTLVVRGSEVDLQELVGAPVQSLIAFELTGSLGDWRPETLKGSLEGKASWDAKGGQRLGSVNLSAAGEGGVLKLSRAEVTSPGLSLRAQGDVSLKELNGFGTLQLKDLSQLGKTLRTFAGVDLPGLAGNGTLRIAAQGPLRGPTAKVAGELNQFSIAGVQAQMLSVNADMPDVSAPLDTDVLLHAERLRFANRAFEDVDFKLLTHGRQLDVELTTKGMGDLRAHATGLLDKDSRGAGLASLELTSAEAKWQLEAPTRMTWAEDFVIDPFSLRDGDQRISGELAVGRARLEAKARVERVDLSKLPQLLALPSLRLAGTLDAEASVSGKPKNPTVLVEAKLEAGQVRGFDGLSVAAKGSWANQRAKGTLNAQSGLGTVAGTFDLPLLAWLERKPGEGTASFTLEDVPLNALEQQLGQALPADGTVSGQLEVSGSGDRPQVHLTLESDDLKVSQDDTGEKPAVSVQAAKLSVFTSDTNTLDATLTFSALGAANQLVLTTPLTIDSLRTQPPTTAEELLDLPLTLTLSLEKLDLRQLDRQGVLRDDELAGEVSLSGIVRGTARAPTGELTLTLHQVTWPPMHQASAKFDLRTGPGETRLTGTASLAQQQQALELVATVKALPERALAALLRPGGGADAMVTSLGEVPLDVLLTLKPFAIEQVVIKREGDPGSSGVLSAELEMGGTLESPNARLQGSLRDLRFDRVALGSGRFDLSSTPTQQRFTVALGGLGRDDFKTKGTTGLDLRLSSLRHGLDWRKAPVELTLESRNFDIGFLSGASELLRVVAGRVDLSGRIDGTLGDPRFLGDASVRGGRLALAGFGDYRDIALELHAANDAFELKKLQATSGAGKVDLAVKGVRQSSGSFAITSAGSADHFPIVVDDQLQATATLRYVLEGDATTTLVDIRRLTLPRVDVELPEVKRKDLQDLQRPADIIVLRPGSMATQRRREKAKNASQAEREGKPLVVRAVIDAPKNIWVKSSDVNVEVGLSDGFRVELNDGLRLFGEARVLRGTVEVIGREFTVLRNSEARFAGPPAQPYVNVSALHVNAREQVKITVSVAGKPPELGIKAASEPPMSESDIYAVLATGRRNLKTSGGATLTPGQAASVVGQLAATQLKMVIAKKLPIDVFNFDTSDNFEKFKLDVGKYLSDVVYLGGSVDIGAKRERGENVWAGRLELQLTKSISLEAYAGDALSFGADAVWSRDF